MPINLEALIIVFLFIIPGYIINIFISRNTTRIKSSDSTKIIEYIFWSGINFVFYYLLNNHISNKSIMLVLSIIVIPLILGLVISMLFKNGWIEKIENIIFQKNVMPSAWDYIFSKRKSYWVLVTLVDGTMIGGLFGENSFASEYPADEDIYIEKVYALDKKGMFKDEIEDSNGVLIKGEQINRIEFFR